MLETKCVGNDYKMMVTVVSPFWSPKSTMFFTLAPGTNIKKISRASKFSHQHPQIVTNFTSATSQCHLFNMKQARDQRSMLVECLDLASIKKVKRRQFDFENFELDTDCFQSVSRTSTFPTSCK